MAQKELKVLPQLHAMVPDLDAQEAGLRRFVGRQFKMSMPDGMSGDGFYEMKEEPVSLRTNRPEFFAEYLKSIQLGDLLPADEETAKAAGVKFEKKPDEVKKEEHKAPSVPSKQ